MIYFFKLIAKIAITSLIVLMKQGTYAQSYGNTKFDIAVQGQKKVFRVSYRPTSTDLNQAKAINAIVYLSKVGEECPKAIEMRLNFTNNEWTCSTIVDSSVVSGLICFFDENNNKDNNNDKGYWIPFSEGGYLKPGSLSSIAYLFAGGWNPELFYLSRNRKTAKELFEQDFSKNPSIKRLYYRWYLTTFDKSDVNELNIFRKELNEFASLNDLNEWELLDISKHYASEKDTLMANKYEKLLFSRYPLGCWATQMGTMKIQKDFTSSNDMNKKKELYQQFKKQTQSSTDECNRRYIELRKGLTMLSRLVVHYQKIGKLNDWLIEVNELSDEFKYPTMIYAAKYLNADKQPSIAENLAKRTIDWMRRYIDTTYRNTAERAYYTDKQIFEQREKRFAEYLDIYGQSLLLQNKISEAVDTFKESAIIYGKSLEIEINQHFIDALIKAGEKERASRYAQEFIKLGKSNVIIEEYYKVLLKNKTTLINDSKDEYNHKQKIAIQKKLIAEKTPDLLLYDKDGNQANLKDYKDKIVIVDFWATWCAPCIAGFDAMQQVVNSYQSDQNVVFLFVNTQEQDSGGKNRAVELFTTKHYPFILLFHERNWSTAQAGVTALPTKIVLDKSGKVRFRTVGLYGSTEEQIAELTTMIEILR